MSTVETGKFEPSTGTDLNLGASGDAVTLPAGVTLKTNTIKDSGGNTIFTSDGSGTLSSVNSSLQGNMVFISSATASASATLDFTSGIDSTYDEYVFYFVNINPVTDNVKFEFQGDTTGTSYAQTITSTAFTAWHRPDNDTSNLSYQGGNDQAQGTAFQYLTTGISYDASHSTCGELHLFAPSSTTYVKQFYGQTITRDMWDDLTDYIATAGYFNTTSAITKIRFKLTSGNINAGTIYLYGIK
tara:strand:- start:829 stop:1557 length:729 start_codon:yes stop_codon:yes gene_type:complete